MPADASLQISATGVVNARTGSVFAFLADLDNHQRIAGPHLDVAHLAGPPGARRGGTVVLRGPLGIHRRARTSVGGVHAPHQLGGSATIGDRTRARLNWRLAEAGSDATHVSFELALDRVAPLERVLWLLGGRRWLRRRAREAIAALAAQV